MWATDGTADWLLWRIPDLRGRIAYDVRFELYDQQALDRIVQVNTRRRDWKAQLDGYDVVVVPGPPTSRATRELLAEDGTERAYADDELSLVSRPGIASPARR